MKFYQIFLILILAFWLSACGSSTQKINTPLETLQTYTQAIKKKDVPKMRLLLSKGSIKMAEDQAKSQNISVDEVILRETLFSPDRKTLKFKNEKIEGDYATIEIETSPDVFDRVPFVKEDGIWKIAKEKYAEEMIKQAEEDEKRLNEQINQGKEQPVEPINTNTQSVEPVNTNTQPANENKQPE
jgi:hypothetical protein